MCQQPEMPPIEQKYERKKGLLGLLSQVLKRSDREMGELMRRDFAEVSSGLADESVVLRVEEFRTFLVTMVQASLITCLNILA